MAGLLEDFGAGLQGAGAILSDRVYDTQARERAEFLPNMARVMQIKKAQRELQADEEFSKAVGGMQPTALTDSASIHDKLKTVPLDVIADSPRAQKTIQLMSQVQARETAAQAKKDALTQHATEHYDKMEQRRIEFDRESTRKESSDLDRAEARTQALRLQEQQNKMLAGLRQQGIDIGRDRSAETERHNREMESAKGDAVTAKRDAAVEKATAPVQDLVADIDQAIKMVQENPGVAGARGIFSRGKELVSTTISGDTNTPANDFQSQILQIQSKWRKLPTVAANRFKSDAGKIDSSIKGLGIGSNDAITVNNLTQLRENLVRGIEARGGEAPDNGAAKDKPATQGIIAVNPKTKERVISTDGGKTWEPLMDK